MKDQVDLMMRLVAVAAYLFVGFFYFVSGLVTGLPAVVLLIVMWFAGWVVLVRALRESPKWAWVVSFAAVIVWVIVVQLGSLFFGWAP